MKSSSPAHRDTPLTTPTLALLLSLTVFTVTRVVLLLWTGIDRVPLALWPGIFAKGLWFDLATLCFLMPAVLAYEALLPTRARHSLWHRLMRLLWL